MIGWLRSLLTDRQRRCPVKRQPLDCPARHRVYRATDIERQAYEDIGHGIQAYHDNHGRLR